VDETCQSEETLDKAVPSAVLPLLRTTSLGRCLEFYTETESTNDVAMRLARQGAAHGTTVVADRQTRGRGRLARTWFSPPASNLYFSVVLRLPVPVVRAPQLALVAALAVVRAVRSVGLDLPMGIKWPNDILLAGRKLAGILCEMEVETERLRHVVAGVGINVNVTGAQFPPDLAQTATSLREAAGRRVSRPQLLASCLNAFEMLLDPWCGAGLAPLLEECSRLSVLTGRWVKIMTPGGGVAGICRGLTADGALLVELADGARRHVLAGDVHVELG
jgi:BirA family biotin operon repressor/biotin-[acetyl-CoA-carboxylase] ligase